MDLRALRERKLNMKTQEEFAELLETDVENVKQWEANPEHIPFNIISLITEKTGLSLNEVTGYQPPKAEPLIVDNTWLKAAFTKKNLADYISQAVKNASLSENQQKAYIDGLQQIISEKITKPKIAIVGRSDTGKSTLINALLGVEKMPTSWTPTTAIAVYIKHISDRPDFIQEDTWIFANQVGDERLWDERRLYDEAYCREWKIASGEVELLSSYGIRQGENYDKAAGAAVVFVDSPALNICDIIDLPGFGTETESDDEITFSATQKSEVIIYLSQANGFMRIEDIEYLKRNIAELPVWEKKGENDLQPLANLFVVASQAHTIHGGNRRELENILNKGCENLCRTLDEHYWERRAAASGYVYNEETSKIALRNRFFAYTTDIPEICTSFRKQLGKVLEALPLIIDIRAKAAVRSYIDSRKPNLDKELEKYEGILSQREQYAVLLSDIKKSELARREDNDGRKKEVLDTIAEMQISSKDKFREYIAQILDVDNLVKNIKDLKLKNKKEDIEQFTSKLQNQIQHQCEYILETNSNEVSQRAADYVEKFSKSINVPAQNLDVVVDFDAAWVFGSALSALGVVGGLGAFAVGIAVEAAFWLSMGLGFGSSLSMGLFLIPAFGPVGLACGLALAGAVGVIKLFSGGWERSVAKKIIAEFEKGHFADKYCEGMDNHWNQTRDAFNKAAAELDESWDKYVKELEEMVDSTNIADITNKIKSLKDIEAFFDNIPL